MQWRNTLSRYGFVASFLHWSIAAGIVAQYLLAEAAEDTQGRGTQALGAATVHQSLGITLLALAAIRLTWRLFEAAPQSPTTVKPIETFIARAAHIMFYVLLFAIPLSGWALATASGELATYFGLFEIPPSAIGAQSGTLGKEQFEEIHEALFNVLAGLAVLHIMAALKHHLFDHDDVLRRMLPWGNRTRTR